MSKETKLIIITALAAIALTTYMLLGGDAEPDFTELAPATPEMQETVSPAVPSPSPTIPTTSDGAGVSFTIIR